MEGSEWTIDYNNVCKRFFDLASGTIGYIEVVTNPMRCYAIQINFHE